MATATARMTLGSVFATVGTAANAISSTLNTGVKAIGMLDTYVSDAAERQSIRSVVDMHDFTESLAEEKAMEEAQRKLQVLDFTKSSKEHAALYATAYDRIQKLLAERKAA